MNIQLTSKLGDSVIRHILMEWEEAPFSPDANWVLLLTAKRARADTVPVFQKATDAGLTSEEDLATVELVPSDTAEETTGNLYVDIRATHAVTGESRTVANFRWQLDRGVNQSGTPSVTIYTASEPAGPRVYNRDTEAWERLFIEDGILQTETIT